MKNKYFGKIEKLFESFYAEYKFKIPYFEKEVRLTLGPDYDESMNEIEGPPTENELNEYEDTFKKFLANIDGVINSIKTAAFEYYKECYAEYYEKEFPLDGIFANPENIEGKMHKPLNIKDKEMHFKYMKEIETIRLLKK
jgi:hypothetical protein